MYLVSELLKPLASGSLTPSQSRLRSELLAAGIAKSTLFWFAKLETYDSDSHLRTVLAITEVFGIESYSGDVRFCSVPQFVDRLRAPIDDFGVTELATKIGRRRQLITQCVTRAGMGIQMACILSRALGWPLRLVIPHGVQIPGDLQWGNERFVIPARQADERLIVRPNSQRTPNRSP